MNYVRMALIVSSLFVLAGCTESREKAEPVQPALAVEQTAELNAPDGGPSAEGGLEDKWGIKMEFATLSASGYMVDVRFRILDPAKAAPLLDRRVKPVLVDQASGATFAVPAPPKVGQLRSGGNVKQGTVCFVYFANPGRYVKAGNKITLEIGDFQARGIVVQ